MSGVWMRRVVLALAFACTHIVVLAIHLPVREFAGDGFFDHWDFYGNVDNTTWGNVTYVDEPTARAQQLIYTNGQGNVVMRVDNFTTLTPAQLVLRNSLRLTTKDRFQIGSLIIIDVVHMPYGCSVWPAFWTLGSPQDWPVGGEIDLIEGVNNMGFNQIAIHTTEGCYQTQIAEQTGVLLEGDCSNDRGCITRETKPNSFGAAFAQAGGGVWALQIAESGIYAWFWSRPDIPENIRNATPQTPIDTIPWGFPTAAYPNTRCNINQFFSPQHLVLLTTLCGAWAGEPSVYASTCQTPTNSCFADNILGNGANYLNAFWEIRYIRIYLSEDAPPPPPPTSATPTPTPTQTPPATTTDPRQLPPPSTSSGSAVGLQWDNSWANMKFSGILGLLGTIFML
ncbi:hypothetical protein CVT24_003865 [Panaeolus cyanescens]|uniref:GH16 domain-containing protein n=1 Tax=Panaeolus cyanescens TaxID=181874 RepID=A0A409VV30_9AGAR|nr:hypothetical protein CVT24_003865 [Panaeolus cyanescens]